jgi:hypothetical protein
MEKSINTMLIHRKIYDEELIDIIENTDHDGGINLFITHEYNNFLVTNFKDKLGPILGYRQNFLNGTFNYMCLFSYTEENNFLKPYHTYTFDSNSNPISMEKIFNPIDIYEQQTNMETILEQNFIRLKVPKKIKFYKN